MKPLSQAAQQRVIELCADVQNDLDRLIPAIVDRIRHQVPEYGAVDRAEHELGVSEQYRGLLAGLAGRRGPNAEELMRARQLGQRRAREGLTLAATMSAFHIGYREMWNVLVERTDSQANLLRVELWSVVDLVWKWVQDASSAAAEAFEQTTRLEDAARTTLLLRLLNGIYGGLVVHTELEQTARALGFDSLRSFRIVVTPADQWEPSRINGFRHELAAHRSGSVVHTETRGTSLVTVSQGVSADLVVDALRAHCPEAAIGVGLERPGLAGAADSATDAEESLLYARSMGRSQVVWFEREWFSISLFQRQARLAPVLGPRHGQPSLSGDAAEAVSSLLDNGFSFSATGRALHLHPNTVRYRVQRWQQLTGWDVRTRQGLLRSIAALAMARRPPNA